MGGYLSSFLDRFGIMNWPGNHFTPESTKKKSALIVVDMQNDFLTGSLALCDCPSKHNGEEIIEDINKLIKESNWDLIVYTMDWHPSDHVSFVTNAQLFKPHSDNQVVISSAHVLDHAVFDIDGKRMEQILWPAHCIQNSEGAKLHKDLAVGDNSIVIKKGVNRNVDSYSAFFDNKRASQTTLDSDLKKHDISRVYICGVATDVCVNFTAFDAINLGYETYVIEDCCRGVDLDQIDSTFTSMKDAGVILTSSKEIISPS